MNHPDLAEAQTRVDAAGSHQRHATVQGAKRLDAIFADNGLRCFRRSAIGAARHDLLVASADLPAAAAALARGGHVAIDLSDWAAAPDATDWLGVASDDTGCRLMHVRLSDRLHLGDASVGRVRVPNVAALLHGSGEETCRAALDLCEQALHDRDVAPEWIPIDTPALRAAIATLFDADTAALLPGADARTGRRALRRRLLAIAAASGASARKRLLARLAAANRAGPRLSLLSRRKSPSPAPVIALIGSDGSGKSTVSRWLAAELDRVIDTRHVYFGTGDGGGSLLRRLLNRLKHLARSPHVAVDSDKPPSVDDVPAAMRLVWAAVVANERAGKMRSMQRGSRAGVTFVTDRYPQAEFSGIHDGPRLGDYLDPSASRLMRTLARWETRLYRRLARQRPDRVVLLDVPLDRAIDRRPEESAAELERRIEVARALEFDGAERRVIDAGLPLPDVQRAVLESALRCVADAVLPTTPTDRLASIGEL